MRPLFGGGAAERTRTDASDLYGQVHAHPDRLTLSEMNCGHLAGALQRTATCYLLFQAIRRRTVSIWWMPTCTCRQCMWWHGCSI